MTDLLVVRILFVLLLTSASYFLQPFQLDRPFSAIAGFLLGLAIIGFEIRVKEVSLKRLIGAATGSVGDSGRFSDVVGGGQRPPQ